MERVLIVENEESLGFLLSVLLRHAGYEAILAIQASEALELLSRQSFSGALVDLRLPHVDGLTLVRKIRATAGWADLPVLIVTAAVEKAASAMEAGADDVILKPYESSDLLRRLDAAMRRRKVGA